MDKLMVFKHAVIVSDSVLNSFGCMIQILLRSFRFLPHNVVVLAHLSTLTYQITHPSIRDIQ